MVAFWAVLFLPEPLQPPAAARLPLCTIFSHRTARHRLQPCWDSSAGSALWPSAGADAQAPHSSSWMRVLCLMEIPSVLAPSWVLPLGASNFGFCMSASSQLFLWVHAGFASIFVCFAGLSTPVGQCYGMEMWLGRGGHPWEWQAAELHEGGVVLPKWIGCSWSKQCFK